MSIYTEPTVPASGPPICHGEMRRSEYERPGDYLCMTCGTWMTREEVEAARSKPEPQQAVKPRDESVTLDGVTYRTAVEKKAEWCCVDGGYGALHIFVTRLFSYEELEEIRRRTPPGLVFVSSALVDQLPDGGFQFDASGKRVPL